MTRVLQDMFGRKHTYLRLSVTDRCNLRCTYCMPAAGICLKPTDEILSLEEIARICRLFSNLGIDKIRLTGGEPLVRKGIAGLCRSIADLPQIRHLGITTNGVLLAGLATELHDAGVNRVNISLDTLRPEKFQRITLRDEFQAVLDGIEAAVSTGFETVRLNIVVISGVNDDEVLDFVEFVRDRPVCVRFIEFMPVGKQWITPTACIPTADLVSHIGKSFELTPVDSESGRLNVAKEYNVSGFRGTIGFISSVTDHFCGGCNRMRITADGMLKTCLNYPAEFNLRDALRSGLDDEQLEALVIGALLEKREARPGALEPVEATSCSLESRAMWEIGG